jgi:GntR family transcriptional regulator / MocR family aminotransferase
LTIGTLDRGSRVPLHRQIYERLQRAILAGHLAPGTRLPSTRTLQEELGVGRNTVLDAFAQLIAEGYLEGRRGSGTFVATTLPDDLIALAGTADRRARAPRTGRLSRRGQLVASVPAMPDVEWRKPRPFYPGIPAYELLPLELWRRLTSKRLRRVRPALLGYGTPHGYRPLRVAIAQHLTAVRGVSCDPDQVIVLAGSQQALDVAARVLLDPGDPVWIEDPAFPGARAAFVGAGARLVPVPVDGDGLDVGAGARAEPGARLAYVSPSHQYPLGASMSVSRRLELLGWASRNEAWIVEDDYDSEFRYGGRPLPALQSLDDRGRVIYVGTFSKVLFPSLRLGYMVVPTELLDGFLAARALSDRHPPTIDQAVLADFIADGHFMRHIRRMRLVYAERQAAMIEAFRDTVLEVAPDAAGMHLIGWLPPGRPDIQAAATCAAAGISAPPLSHYYAGAAPRGGLLLGYTGFAENVIAWGARRMASALENGSP